jgi:hypothetical protein
LYGVNLTKKKYLGVIDMSERAATVESKKRSYAKELAAMKESLGELLLALQCPLTTKERHDLW